MNSKVRKLCLSAMLIALSIIATKILGINPGFSFVRISFGPALIIFASLYLGPVYGIVVGAASDALGAVLIPTGPYEPLFTVVYGFLGLAPWLINLFVKKIKNTTYSKVFYDILVVLLLSTSIFTILFFPQIDNKTLVYVYIGISVLLGIGMMIISEFINKYFMKRNPEYNNKFYHYGIVCILTEIICMILINSLVKSIHFELPYLLIFEWMCLIAFINIPINTFAVYYLELIEEKIHRGK